MLLISLLFTPIIGVFSVSLRKYTGASGRIVIFRGLITSSLTFLVSMIITIFILLSTLYNNYVRVLFSSDNPCPHKFCNLLLSSGNDKTEALKKALLKIHKELTESRVSSNELSEDERLIRRTLDLQNKIGPNANNASLNELIDVKYSSFFDEESENTKEEGLNQCLDYVKQEKAKYKTRVTFLERKKALIQNQYEKELNNLKDLELSKEISQDIAKVAENTKNAIFPVIVVYTSVILRIFVAFFSFFFYFNFIDIDLLYLIKEYFVIPNFILPTIITTVLLFVWESYRLYSRTVRYYSFILRFIFLYRFIGYLYLYLKIK